MCVAIDQTGTNFRLCDVTARVVREFGKIGPGGQVGLILGDFDSPPGRLLARTSWENARNTHLIVILPADHRG